MPLFTPPAYNAVDFALALFTPPANNAVDFLLASGNAFSLTAESTSFSLAGTDATLVHSSGPTIVVQPQDTRVVLSDAARRTATFTVAGAAILGLLHYQWKADYGAGFVNIGVDSPAYSVTPVDTSLNGTLVKCTLTDDLGSSDTNTVTLNVYNGFTLPATLGPTNAAGVATIEFDYDEPLTTGQVILLEMTSEGTLVRTTARNT